MTVSDNRIKDILIVGGGTAGCTGFAGLLIDKTLKDPFVGWSDFLLCDRVWALSLEYDAKLPPYTQSTALKVAATLELDECSGVVNRGKESLVRGNQFSVDCRRLRTAAQTALAQGGLFE